MIHSLTSPFDLSGKTVLVTGASSGLGHQIAVSCAERGARMILTGRNSARLEKTYAKLEGSGHIWIQADLTIEGDIDRLVTSCGPVDGLINSAGIQKLCPVRQLSKQAMSEMYNSNFLAPVMLTQKLLYAKHINDKASIVYLLSTAAHMGTRGLAPYSSMKAALIGFIKCLALEQAKYGIRVNGISPSAVVTPMWSTSHLEDQKARHPLGLGEPQDVANAAVFMLSRASRWITGTTLVMDGGAV